MALLHAALGAAEPRPSSLDVTNTVLAVAASIVAVVVFAASTALGSRILIWWALMTVRLAVIVRPLTRRRRCSWGQAIVASHRQSSKLIAGDPQSAAGELEWLTALCGRAMPISFALDGELNHQEILRELATAYEHAAGRWRSRLLFGTRASELLASIAGVSEDTSIVLREHSSNARLDWVAASVTEIDLRPRGHFARLFYAERSLDLVVSPFPKRLDPVPGQLVGGGAQPQFEGILPHLLGQQIELDEESGRHRLHLAVGEMPYSQLRSRNTAWDPAGIPDSSRTHAVSLALLPVTQDRRVLFIRRSAAAGSYPGMIGPYVTGNAELRDRRGLRADRDQFGLPDLMAAVCREAREEVGLVLEPDHLRVLGLARIWSPEDTAIWCLIASAALKVTAKQAAEQVRYGDPVEGSWEVGDEMFAVDPWHRKESARDVLNWAASAEMVPQAVAALVALLRKSNVDVSLDWGSASAAPNDPLSEPVLLRLPLRHPFR